MRFVKTRLLTSSSGVLHQIYWLTVNTSSYSRGVNSVTKWYNYGICYEVNGGNSVCSDTVAAYPFSPFRNFRHTFPSIFDYNSLPDSFSNNENTYYYLTRCAYGFSIVAVVFLVAAIIPHLVFIFGRKGGIATIIFYTIGFIFLLTSVVLSTAAYTKGRNAFNDDGSSATLGSKAFGLAWGSVGILIFAFISLIISHVLHRKDLRNTNANITSYYDTQYSDSNILNAPPEGAKPAEGYGVAIPDASPHANSPSKFRGINFLKVNRKTQVKNNDDESSTIGMKAETSI
ncbi:hypothetical protein B5S33_g476 [[Candida] boidinii]|nr:hypothetical protein B5S27_g1143 [[Candida] boidinii]OWB67315.1 hypothetical protein B5S30_g2672 [[Candida] boidinii]OWB81856.1 hypothetical protein B5S33_g476 [[Candida] boidinii]